ncbi:MAG: hypothetical protein AABZ47_05795 [Planctomycetota bacterium]
MNTCIWGGMFNAIVPFYRRTPNGWSDSPLPPPKAVEIVRGFLDVFDPDFIVTMEPTLAKLACVDASRVIQPGDVLDEARDEPIGYGVSIQSVYRDLYERSFQFVRCYPRTVGLPTLRDDRYALFAGAAFGRFPNHNAANQFREEYQKAFYASEFQIEPDSLQQVLSGKVHTPLLLGSSEFTVEPQGMQRDLVLFLLDVANPRDIIEFWNHRALGWPTVPIPVQWQDDLIDFCRKLVLSRHVQPQFMYSLEILRTRSLSDQDVQSFIKKLQLPRSGAVTFGHYPRIWDEWARQKGHADRFLINAGQSEEECVIEDGRIVFWCQSPQFDTGFGPPISPMYANVIHLSDHSGMSELATVLPPDMPGLGALLDTSGLKSGWTRAASEGIVSLCDFGKQVRFWRVPTSLTVMQSWLKSQGFDTELSGPGRTCMQVVRQLCGLHRVGLIANDQILRRLDQMAHGLVETPEGGAPPHESKPRARSRAASCEGWLQLLNDIHKKSKRIANRDLDHLTKRGVLRIGLKLPCTTCEHENWYALNQLAESVQCEHCLQSLPFPIAHPPNHQSWAYRTQGPFSVENYAQGGYSVALALRCLVKFLGTETTWTPCLAVKAQKQQEIDFAMWCRTRSEGRNETVFVIGECKSFNNKKRQFTTKDVNRARALAKRFPSAVLVFATLASELHPMDKKQIASFARAGRFRPSIESWHTPVLVLTGIELLSQWGPPQCWEDAGVRFAPYGKHFSRHGDLMALCDVSQQIHLSLESYASRQHKYFDSN